LHVSRPATVSPHASLTALASSALFAAMAMLARRLSHTIPGQQIALVRFVAGLLVVALACPFLHLDLRPRRLKWLIARGVFGGAAVLMYFRCIEKIGVGLATLLNYTAPVWSLLFAWLLLGERPRRSAGVALALTLVGVGLVTNVGAGASHIGVWQMVGVLSAVFSGIAITSIRATRMTDPGGRPSESSWTVFASFTLFGTLTTLPTVAPPFGHWAAPTLREWSLLGACSLLSVVAQLLMTSSLDRLTAVGLGIIQQVTVVLALMGGWLFFDEAIGLRGGIGSLLTISGVLWSVLAERNSAGRHVKR
jgi:drug/metabolite transporter (DMT)-like permease